MKRWRVKAYLADKTNPKVKAMDITMHVSPSLLREYIKISRKEGVELPTMPAEPWLIHMMLRRVKERMPKHIVASCVKVNCNNKFDKE